MNTLRNRQLAALFTAALFSGATLAGTDEEVTTVTGERLGTTQEIAVSYADLNLNSPEGQEVLFSRISRAARSICGPAYARDAGGLGFAVENRACYKETLSRAMSDLPTRQVAATR